MVLKNCIRYQSFSTNIMKAWVVRDFSKPMSFESLKIPELTSPEHMLVKVKAAGVNPIDTLMCKGYGDVILSLMKKVEDRRFKRASRLPFIGGREFSGIVASCGGNVKRFKKGDQVMGVVGPTYAGSHAEYVLVKESWCCAKPSKTSFVEAASVLYSGCTMWSALVTIARLDPKGCDDIRVLINGGSGSVGTVAIQMLKIWGVPVVVSTCSPKNRSLVESLGAVAVNYTDEVAAKEQLISLGPFDIILDCVESDLAEWTDKLLGIWRNSVHVSLISPLLYDTDRLGVVPGTLFVAAKYFRRSILPATRGRWFSYAYFTPNLECIEQMGKLIDNRKLKPVVEKTYAFPDLPTAYKKVSQRHGFGKTVIDFGYDRPLNRSHDMKTEFVINEVQQYTEINTEELEEKNLDSSSNTLADDIKNPYDGENNRGTKLGPVAQRDPVLNTDDKTEDESFKDGTHVQITDFKTLMFLK